MKLFLKILTLLLYIAGIIVGVFYAFIWILCGGDGVGFLSGMLIIAVIFGSGFFYWLFKDNDKKKEENVVVLNQKGLSPTHRQLTGYIYFARKKNLSDIEITRNLETEGGWSNDEIKAAFDLINI